MSLFPYDFAQVARFFVVSAKCPRTAADWLGPVVTPTPDLAKPFAEEPPVEAVESHKAMAEHFAGKPT